MITKRYLNFDEPLMLEVAHISSTDDWTRVSDLTIDVNGYFKRYYNAVQHPWRVDPIHYVQIDDGGVPIPDDVVVTFINKVKNPNFQAQKKAGIIVMSNYSIGHYTIRFSPESRLVYSGLAGYANFTMSDFSDMGLATVRVLVQTANGSGYWETFLANPGNYINLSSVSFKLYEDRYAQVIPDVDVNLIKSLFSDSYPIDPVLTQQNIADANNGDIDALTSVMEASETVDSIINGLRMIARMAVDLKKGQITLTNRHQAKVRLKAKREFDRKRKFPGRRKYLEREGSLNNYDKDREDFYKSYKRDLDEYTRTRLSNLRKSEIRELNDAIADTWLNYRYNIMPNVMMIKDACKALDHMNDEYRTYRSKKVDDVDIPLKAGQIFNGTASVTHRVVTKRQLKNQDGLGSMILSSLGLDVFVTALELVPIWGVVVNWFSDVSNFLQAIPWNVHYKQSVTSYSTKIEINGTILDKNGGSVLIAGSTYYRKVINPYEYLGVHVNLDLNTKRYLDTVAYLSKIVKVRK